MKYHEFWIRHLKSSLINLVSIMAMLVVPTCIDDKEYIMVYNPIELDPANIVFKAGIDKDRSETQINQVGTVDDLLSDQTEIRGTLPTFTDLNTKYYTSTGNDTTGTGTSANPYATLEKAF